MSDKWNKGFWIILILAIAVRVFLLIDFPHAIFHEDTIGYTDETHALIKEGTNLGKDRTIGYPLFLIGVLTIFGGDYLAVVLVQMILGIAVSVLLYHLFWEFYTHRSLSLWLFGLTSIGTLEIVFETMILPELLFSVFLTLCFWMIIRLYKSPKLIYFALFGLFAGIAVIIKPSALFFALIGILTSILTFMKTFQWFKKIVISSLLYYGAFLIILLGHATLNYYNNNFFGLNKFKGIQLFSVSAHLIDNFDSPKHKKIKRIIKTDIQNYNKSNINNSDWFIYSLDGPKIMMQNYSGKTALEFDKLCYELAIEAILDHPFQFAYERTKVFSKFLYSATGVHGNFHTNSDILIKSSWNNMQGNDHRYDLKKYNRTHPNVNDGYKKREGFTISWLPSHFVQPLSSPGSFVRLLLILSPARILPIWIFGFILSFYFLFIRYKSLNIMSAMIVVYAIVLFHFGIHSLMTKPIGRYVYPVLQMLMFFSIMTIAEWKSRKVKQKMT